MCWKTELNVKLSAWCPDKQNNVQLYLLNVLINNTYYDLLRAD